MQGTVRALVAIAAAGLAACDTGFESPELVIDLRVLGMTASPPEIVASVDPDDPASISFDDVGSTELCALIADPGAERALRWRMEACPPANNGRCPDRFSPLPVGQGVIEDPETQGVAAAPCATLQPSLWLAGAIEESARADDLLGFGNVSVMISLAVWPDGEPIAVAEWAEKKMRYAPRIPEARVANQNPTLDAVRIARAPTGGRGDDFDLPLGRCGEIAGFPVAPGERIQAIPRETDGARENYLVPTFDGGQRMLTEALSYQYYATAGNWTRFGAGGPRDSAGNRPPIDSRWSAPDDAELIGDGLDVSLWIIVRDERGGQAWYESCARVVP